MLCNRLDVYIHDYFVKRKLHNSAKAFQQEGKVSTDPVGKKSARICQILYLNLCVLVVKGLTFGFLLLLAIDAPGGFLFEWWSVFWDIFIARTNEKHSDAAASYIEVSRILYARS